jgi:hypothetical protein
MNPPLHQLQDLTGYAANRISEVTTSARKFGKYLSHDTEGVTLFAVDTDVVQMFLSPAENRSYGAILRYQLHARKTSDPMFDEVEERLVEFVSTLILFDVLEYPLALLPAHSDELGGNLNQIFKKAKTTYDALKIEIENTNNALKILAVTNLTKAKEEARHDPTLANDKAIAKLVSKVREKVFTSGPANELMRFDALSTQSERLKHIDRFQFFDAAEKQIYLPPPLLKNQANFVAPVQRLINRIYPQLVSFSGAATPSRLFRLQRDAQALAHLAWVNDLLQRDEYFVKGKNGLQRVKKFNLITGSNLVPLALESLGLESLALSVVSPLAFLGHPIMQSYLDGSDVKTVELAGDKRHNVNSPTALLDFLEAIGASFSEAVVDEESYLKKIKGAVEEMKSLVSGWASQQLVNTKGIFSSIDEAVDELSSSGSNLDQLSRYLEGLSNRTFSQFARASSMVSLGFMAADDESIVKRNIPPVNFGHFEYAKLVCHALYSLGDSDSGRKNANATLTKENLKKLAKEDPSNYTEFICYTLWALVHRNLSLASGCASVAWSLVPTDDKRNPNDLSQYIYGEESLYLMSHVKKLMARRADHLDEAEACLIAAKSMRHKAHLASPDQFLQDDARFEAESYSIECHRVYFQAFGQIGKRGKIEAQVPRVENLLVLASKGRTLLDSPLINTEDAYGAEYIKQLLLVNLVQIGLLCIWGAGRRQERNIDDIEVFQLAPLNRDEFVKFQNDTTCLVEQCERLSSNADIRLSLSHLSECVAVVGGAAFNQEKLPLKRSLYSGIVAEIDSLRFSYLEKVLKRVLGDA